MVPGGIRHALLGTGSLTALVRALCPGRFGVSVLCHEWRPVPAAERGLLRILPGEQALTRQVYLRCDGEPWVFAHSVMPARSLVGGWRRLRRLGNRPLGAALFADPAVRRGELEVGWLQPGNALYDELAGSGQMPERVWGRRSLFYLHGRPLMVCEFFLPAFVRVLEQRRNGHGSQ